MKCQLESAFDEVVDVSLLDSKDSKNLALLERPDLGVTFTKLHCWRLVQYSKCVFLDADTMVNIYTYVDIMYLHTYFNISFRLNVVDLFLLYYICK